MKLFDWFKKLPVPAVKKKAEGYMTIEGAPCKSGGHTTYLIGADNDGAFHTFPTDNFNLTTDEHQAYVRSRIEEMGFEFKP